MCTDLAFNISYGGMGNLKSCQVIVLNVMLLASTNLASVVDSLFFLGVV